MISSISFRLLAFSMMMSVQLHVQSVNGFAPPHRTKLRNSVHSSTSKQFPPTSHLFIGVKEDELDVEIPDGVVCARGICVTADEDVAEELCFPEVDDENYNLNCIANSEAIAQRNVFSFQFLWPRALLLLCSILYGTNPPLVEIIENTLPASAATSGRMILAALALSPFLFQLKPELRKNALIGGSFVALGYLSQSVALLDVPAGTVGFIGGLVVIITPLVNYVLNKDAKLAWKDAPQTWLAAVICLIGVATIELGGGEGLGGLAWGDLWAVLQAVGFGTAYFFTEGMMARNPDQALSITAVQVSMIALYSAIWAALDGTGVLGSFGGDNGAWLLDEATRSQYAFPGLYLSGLGGDETLRNVAIAAVWSGVFTTSGNRFLETTALGRVKSSEASVILAIEPLWVALFASVLTGETFGIKDILGGGLIVAACILTAFEAETMRDLLGITLEDKLEGGVDDPANGQNSPRD